MHYTIYSASVITIFSFICLILFVMSTLGVYFIYVNFSNRKESIKAIYAREKKFIWWILSVAMSFIVLFLFTYKIINERIVYINVRDYVKGNEEQILSCMKSDEISFINFKEIKSNKLILNKCNLPFMDKEVFYKIDGRISVFEEFKVILKKDDKSRLEVMYKINGII